MHDSPIRSGLGACGFLAAHAAWVRRGGGVDVPLTPILAVFGTAVLPEIVVYEGNIAENLPQMRERRERIRSTAAATATVVEARLSEGFEAFLTEWTEQGGAEGRLVWPWRFRENGDVGLAWPPQLISDAGRLTPLAEAGHPEALAGIEYHAATIETMMASLVPR